MSPTSLPQIDPQVQRRAFRSVVVMGSLVLGYVVGKRLIKNFRSRQTSLLADDSPDVRQAMRLRSAMNPSGTSWLMWMDGTKEAEALQVAGEIASLDAVARAYRNLYSSELIKDLQGELSAKDFNAFLQAVASGQNNQSVDSGTTQKSGSYTSPQKLIAAKQSVFVRTSPDASYHGRFYEVRDNKNIFKTAKAGEFIGYATGKQHFDSKNNVRFIEVGYRIGNSTQVLWVSASSMYTEQFDSQGALLAKYPKNRSALQSMQPLSGLGSQGFSGPSMITTSPTMAYDTDFQPMELVATNTLVGTPRMTMVGGDTDYTLVQTAAGRELWLASKNLKRQ